MMIIALLVFCQIGISQTTTGGIGANIDIDAKSKFPFIVNVVKGLPAGRMNLAPNDFITKINGQSTYNYTLDQLIGQLRGPVGTSCSITIWRNNVAYPLTFIREAIPVDQVTINPSCYSNCRGWSIEKITQTNNSTLVDLKFYTARKDASFFIHPLFYIENNNVTGSAKYYIKRFVGNELNKLYNVNSFTEYNFTLEFEKIPADWTDINIKHPAAGTKEGFKPAYFNNITLNIPPTTRMPMDNFFLNSGIEKLASMAHPANYFEYYRYCMDYDHVWVDIFYRGGAHTELRIDKIGKVFTDIVVLKDTDNFTPFKAFSNLVNSSENPIGAALVGLNGAWALY
jgi:hypothetical protein